MSMVFAGFMAAAQDKMKRKEELEAEQAREERDWQRQLDLLDIKARKEQEILDAKVKKDTEAFMKMTGTDPTQFGAAYSMMESIGMQNMIGLWESGRLDFSVSDTTTSTSWDGQVSDNGKILFDTFVNELGYDPTIAAGLVGNFMQESGVGINTAAVGDGGNSFGAGQWNGPRKTAFLEFVQANSLDVNDPRTAALFTDYELKTSESKAWEKIQAAAGDPARVAAVASEAFWRPGMPMVENRMQYANAVWSQLGDTAKVAPQTSAAMDDTVFTPSDGLSFGTDQQMADLGMGQGGLSFGTPVPQSPAAPTLSTAGGDPAQEERRGILLPATPDVTEYLKGVTTVNAVDARIRVVQNDPNLSRNPELQQRIVSELEAMKETFRLNSDKPAGGASAEDTWLFVPKDQDGKARIGAAIQISRSGDGWVNNFTGEPVDVNAGVVVSNSEYDTFQKQYNDETMQIGQDVAAAKTAVADLNTYRNLVIEQPIGLNQYAGIATSLAGQIKALESAGISLLRADGSYDYTSEADILNAIGSLSGPSKLIAQAQLRAAYAVTASRGSTGQGLSNEELLRNLNTLGGTANPSTVVDLLNREMQTIVSNTEARRRQVFDSIVISDALRTSLSDAPFARPFEETLKAGVDETNALRIDEALQGKTDYDYTMKGDGQTSGAGYVPVTPQMVAEDPRLAPYEGKRIKAVRRNGKIEIVVEGE